MSGWPRIFQTRRVVLLRRPVSHLVLPPAAADVAGADREVANLATSGIQRVILSTQAGRMVGWRRDRRGGLSQGLCTGRGNPVRWLVNPRLRDAPDSLTPVGVSFANGVTLAAAAPDSRELIPGGVLVVHLQWRGPHDGLTGTENLDYVLEYYGQLPFYWGFPRITRALRS